MATSRAAYTANVVLFAFSITFFSFVPFTGCTTIGDFFGAIDDAEAKEIIKELNATLEAFETAVLPDDASPLQILAFQAIQTARRLLIQKLLSTLKTLDPTSDLSEYQQRLDRLEPLEPDPD